jgi:hypothetical protein
MIEMMTGIYLICAFAIAGIAFDKQEDLINNILIILFRSASGFIYFYMLDIIIKILCFSILLLIHWVCFFYDFEYNKQFRLFFTAIFI